MYDPQLYDDEYDDTYDINNVGADDADSADELTQRRYGETIICVGKKEIYFVKERTSKEDTVRSVSKSSQTW
jgi:hypothetical protein